MQESHTHTHTHSVANCITLCSKRFNKKRNAVHFLLICKENLCISHNSGNLWICMTCFIFRGLIRCIKYVKKQQMYFGFTNVLLLHSDHQHVLTTCVAILGWRAKEYKYN